MVPFGRNLFSRGVAQFCARQYAILRIMVERVFLASVVVCAEPFCWYEAGRFAANVLFDAELSSFEDL